MTYVVSDMAEAQAIGLCWLARQKGLPNVAVLRQAVVVLHPSECGWCVYPPAELARLLEARSVSKYAEKAWWELPNKARARAIAMAQGLETAA